MQSRMSLGRTLSGRKLKLALAATGALVLAWGMPTRAQKSPDETIKALQVAPGLEATVFASEPMFANPCDMEVDARGRVWITEGLNYRASKLRPNEGDRIVIM